MEEHFSIEVMVEAKQRLFRELAERRYRTPVRSRVAR